MNSKIGIKESSRMITFLILPQMVLHQISWDLQNLCNGMIFNYIIYSVVFFVLIKLMKKSFTGYDQSINPVFEKAINTIYIIYVFFMTLYNFTICSEALIYTSSGIFNINTLMFLPFVSAVICAVLGLESISRASYIAFYIVGLIVIFIIMLTFKGWSAENIYPVFGNNFAGIFKEFSLLKCFFGTMGIYFLKNNFKNNNAYTAFKNVFFISFVFGLTIIILCILTIPYPMGELYKFSLNAIFSVAKSGSFFHRFELVLLFFLLMLQILSASVGLYLISAASADFVNLKDYKPFCLLFGVIIFFLSMVTKNINVIQIAYYISSALLIILILLKSHFKLSKRKES